MKYVFSILITLPIFISSCNKKEVISPIGNEESELNISPGKNHYEDINVTIRRVPDGIERGISLDTHEWLGDRYSDPILRCDSSSIDRLLECLVLYPNNNNEIVRGKELLPKGTYQYSFKKPFKDINDAFKGVVQATEKAFNLNIKTVTVKDHQQLTITRMQKKSQ